MKTHQIKLSNQHHDLLEYNENCFSQDVINFIASTTEEKLKSFGNLLSQENETIEEENLTLDETYDYVLKDIIDDHDNGTLLDGDAGDYDGNELIFNDNKTLKAEEITLTKENLVSFFNKNKYKENEIQSKLSKITDQNVLEINSKFDDSLEMIEDEKCFSIIFKEKPIMKINKIESSEFKSSTAVNIVKVLVKVVQLLLNILTFLGDLLNIKFGLIKLKDKVIKKLTSLAKKHWGKALTVILTVLGTATLIGFDAETLTPEKIVKLVKKLWKTCKDFLWQSFKAIIRALKSWWTYVKLIVFFIAHLVISIITAGISDVIEKAVLLAKDILAIIKTFTSIVKCYQ